MNRSLIHNLLHMFAAVSFITSCTSLPPFITSCTSLPKSLSNHYLSSILWVMINVIILCRRTFGPATTYVSRLVYECNSFFTPPTNDLFIVPYFVFGVLFLIIVFPISVIEFYSLFAISYIPCNLTEILFYM